MLAATSYITDAKLATLAMDCSYIRSMHPCFKLASYSLLPIMVCYLLPALITLQSSINPFNRMSKSMMQISLKIVLALALALVLIF